MPNRILRDTALDSDRIASVDEPSEVLFYRLIMLADDFGRFDGRVAVIRARAFALRQTVKESDIEIRLAKLSTAGLIFRYQVNGKPYLVLQRWKQRHRSEKSRFPDPPDVCQSNDGQMTDRRPASAHVDVDVDVDVDGDVVKPLDATASDADFESLWTTYPKRAGNNPKRRALKAYRALLSKKHTPQEILEGAVRYARYALVTGKVGTEYVMQVATFLGPDRPFLQPWTPPNGQGAWDRTEPATLAKGKELGLPAKPGESMEEYRARIRERLSH